MRIAVVRNRQNEGILYRFGQACPETCGRRSVQRVLDSLRACGHTAKPIEGDKSLLRSLAKFFVAEDPNDPPGELVFNMAYGIQGQARYAHVPAMLEMAGVPYTGACPLGQAVSLDKVVAKILMEAAGVPTPAFCVMRSADSLPENLQFPLVVKPCHESTSYGLRLVRDPAQLAEAVRLIVEHYQQDALVEEFIEGRELCVSLLGNEDVQVLPVVELDFAGRDLQTMTWEDKYHKRQDEPQKLCPAPIDDDLVATLETMARASFKACYCRDYARLDIRLDAENRPFVLEINSMASLGGGGSYVMSAKQAGYDFDSLIGHIVDVAHKRCFGSPAPRSQSPATAAAGPEVGHRSSTQSPPCVPARAPATGQGGR